MDAAGGARSQPERPATTAQEPDTKPSSFSLDGQPPSPWLDSLRKNLEDLFKSQRPSVEMTSAASGGISA
jgi:hypothetical protein